MTLRRRHIGVSAPATALGLLAALAVLPSGCGRAGLVPSDYLVGHLGHEDLVEASGLACGKHGQADWVVNDGGGDAALYALARDGGDLGAYPVRGATNIDWEDLALLPGNDGSELLVADIGDNSARRDRVFLYLLRRAGDPEPGFEAYRRISVEFPGGPRDAEGVAVDSSGDTAYLLSKRTTPAELYTVALDGGDRQTATYLGDVTSLPQPSALDLRLAPLMGNGWYWQPTAMDIAADGTRAVILTYGGIYLYTRAHHEEWIETLNGDPRFFRLPRNVSAESICIRGDEITVTFEGRHAPVYRIPVDAEGWSDASTAE